MSDDATRIWTAAELFREVKRLRAREPLLKRLAAFLQGLQRTAIPSRLVDEFEALLRDTEPYR